MRLFIIALFIFNEPTFQALLRFIPNFNETKRQKKEGYRCTNKRRNPQINPIYILKERVKWRSGMGFCALFLFVCLMVGRQ